MKLEPIKREMFFYPKCFDDPKEKAGKLEDRLKVNFKSYPSGIQKTKYLKYAMVEGGTTLDYDYVEIIVNHVGSIDNLMIGEDKIDTAVKLGDYKDVRLYDLIVEIKNWLLKSEGFEQGES